MIHRITILILFALTTASMYAQEMDTDEGWISVSELHQRDSAAQAGTHVKTVTDSLPEPVNTWRPNPMRAVWMATIIPGYGQIYNRSYWKLPIVYGAFMGCAYAITWTNGLYTDYKEAYRDIATDPDYNPTDPTKSYVAILPKGYSIDGTSGGGSMGGKSKYTSYLQNNMNTYRRYRDISIVASIVAYMLSIIDAYVDAQLYDFDISPDLSLNIEPTVNRDRFNNQTTELKLAITF